MFDHRLNKIYDALTEKINQQYAIVRFLFKRGLVVKQAQMEAGQSSANWFYDTLIFNTVVFYD